VCLHGCAIACALKQTFAQFKIFLEGTLAQSLPHEAQWTPEVSTDQDWIGLDQD